MNRTGPALQDFIGALRDGPVVWVEDGAAPRVCAGAAAAPGALPLRDFLFDAIAGRYGEDAALLAWREAHAAAGATSLPAATLAQVIGCAESLGSLSDACGQVLQLEWSATLLGRRFSALCREQGIDPAALSLAERQAIDEAMRRDASGDAPTLRLLRLLVRATLH